MKVVGVQRSSELSPNAISSGKLLVTTKRAIELDKEVQTVASVNCWPANVGARRKPRTNYCA
jgi:hypothetical protein